MNGIISPIVEDDEIFRGMVGWLGGFINEKI